MAIAALILIASLASFVSCGGGGGGGTTAEPPAITVGGTVNGLGDSGVILQNNGAGDLSVTSNGSFAFSATAGEAYQVTVKTQPTCPTRSCLVSNGSGTVGTGSITNVTLTCTAEKIMFFSSNWGDQSIKITDDINSLPSGTTAAPRVIAGANTTITNPTMNSLAVDRARNMIYMTDAGKRQIDVFHNAKTTSGDIPPDRIITIPGANVLDAIAVDSTLDRLYVTGSDSEPRIWILNNASSLLTGQTNTPTAVLNQNALSLFLDPENDRLYVGGFNIGNAGEVYVYDHAGSLITSAAPDRTITFPVSILPYGLSVDACTDRLFFASRQDSAAGNNIFILESASTLSGARDPDTQSLARIKQPVAMNVMVHDNDRLYFWGDSANSVSIYDLASSLTGTVTRLPDRIIYGVVNAGYGMDYLTY